VKVDDMIQSFDVYQDLLGKCQKGVEFYQKLEKNVQVLLERTQRVCQSQEEERRLVMERLQPKGSFYDLFI
jgi:tyrosine-protein phosphatase non-receptor type 23